MKKILLIAFAACVFTAQAQITHQYSFDNGTADDEVGSMDGTMTNVSTTTDRKGNADKALSFNGTSSKISLGKSSLLLTSTGSISVWVKRAGNAVSNSNLSYDPIFIAKNTSTAASFEGAALGVNRSSGNWFSTTTLPGTSPTIKIVQKSNIVNDEWHHLVMTYNINTLTFYVDGISAGSVSKGFTSAFSSSFNAMIGYSDNTTYKGYFNGDIDDLVIYDIVIGADDVSDIYNGTITSLAKENVSEGLNIYPNPATDFIQYKGYGQLYDIVGNKLMEATDKMNITTLESGVYVLKQNNQIRKFIKE